MSFTGYIKGLFRHVDNAGAVIGRAILDAGPGAGAAHLGAKFLPGPHWAKVLGGAVITTAISEGTRRGTRNAGARNEAIVLQRSRQAMADYVTRTGDTEGAIKALMDLGMNELEANAFVTSLVQAPAAEGQQRKAAQA